MKIFPTYTGNTIHTFFSHTLQGIIILPKLGDILVHALSNLINQVRTHGLISGK